MLSHGFVHSGNRIYLHHRINTNKSLEGHSKDNFQPCWSRQNGKDLEEEDQLYCRLPPQYMQDLTFFKLK